MLGPSEHKPLMPGNPQGNSQLTGRDIAIIALLTLGMILLVTLGASLLTASIQVYHALQEGKIDLMDQEGLMEWAKTAEPNIPDKVEKLIQFLIVASTIVPTWWYLKKRNLSLKTHLRLHPVPLSLLGYSALIGVGLSLIGSEIASLIDMVAPFPKDLFDGMQNSIAMNDSLDVVLLVVTVAIATPITEEFLFRGLLQRWLERHRGVTSGVLWTSAIFAAIHTIPYLLIPILIMAVILGAIVWRAESVWPAVVAHAAANGLDLILVNAFGETQPEWFDFHGHVSPWLLIPALAALIWGTRQFFATAQAMGLGGHGPKGDSGNRLDTRA